MKQFSMNFNRLLKTWFAEIVKEAIEKGEITSFNKKEWVTKYNHRFDQILYNEVEALYRYYVYGIKP